MLIWVFVCVRVCVEWSQTKEIYFDHFMPEALFKKRKLNKREPGINKLNTIGIESFFGTFRGTGACAKQYESHSFEVSGKLAKLWTINVSRDIAVLSHHQISTTSFESYRSAPWRLFIRDLESFERCGIRFFDNFYFWTAQIICGLLQGKQ